MDEQKPVFTISRRALVWGGLACFLFGFLLSIGHFYGPLYLNNQWKPHRWASEYCRAKGIDPHACAAVWGTDPRISTEKVYFDLCLEHGEYRRMK